MMPVDQGTSLERKKILDLGADRASSDGVAQSATPRYEHEIYAPALLSSYFEPASEKT